MSTTYKGTYRGHLKHLVGERALLMDVAGAPAQVKALFDSLDLPKEHIHAWKVYRRRDFDILNTVNTRGDSTSLQTEETP